MIIHVIGWFALILFTLNILYAIYVAKKDLDGARKAETRAALFLICAAIYFKPIHQTEYITKSCGQGIAVMSADGKSAVNIPYCP